MMPQKNTGPELRSEPVSCAKARADYSRSNATAAALRTMSLGLLA